MMRPMRIRAYLLDGRIAGTESWFPLDSILASAWMHLHRPEICYQPIQGDLIVADLPLERRGSGDRWHWACSFNVVKPIGEYITHWHKRFDDTLEKYLDFKGRRGKVDGKSGKYKAYRMPLNILLMPYLEWYAVGDIDAVRDLCMRIVSLGKKPSQGYGMVERWEVEPVTADYSEVKDGKLTRAVYDLPEGVAGNIRMHGMRPPYWLRENQAKVWMP